jgi:glycosyltransferase involved in cell wall biosynthesis
MKERKLTITIPVYERYEYFEEALMSAVNQVVDVEVIVVDNASSHSKFENFTKSLNLDNITYYKNTLNLGMYGNWNRCIELCQTEFVMILCDDDILDEQYSTIFYERLAEYPEISCFHVGLARFGNLHTENKSFKQNRITGYHSGIELLKHAAKHGLDSIEPNAFAFKAPILTDFKYNMTSNSYNADYLFTYIAFIDGFFYGEDENLLKLRIHETAGGILSGNLPYLSCSYVFNQIKLKLKTLNLPEYKDAALKEKNILRNAIVRNCNLYEDIVKITSNPNDIFGIQIKNLMENDFLSRITLKTNGVLRQSIIFYFRIIRKLRSF